MLVSAKAVQISLDAKLLAAIDADRETKEEGRSAFIRRAVEAYLRAKRSREIDDNLRRAYSDPKARAEQAREVDEWSAVQAWPDDWTR